MPKCLDDSLSYDHAPQQLTRANSRALLFGRVASWHSRQRVVFIVPVC